MKGVLLVDMGGAKSPRELKLFLKRMFKDPYILPLGKLGRQFLSYYISNTRYRKSWKKYKLIGGSPIIEATRQTMLALQEKLPEDFKVRYAFSYSSPLIKESMDAFMAEGIHEITVLPLYPQGCFSTTKSVEHDVNKVVAKNPQLKIHITKEFYQNKDFVDYWSNLILNHAYQHKLDKPLLLFSAHSIPTYLVEKGDTYPAAIEASAKAIANHLGFEYEVAYQSGMKRGTWLTPDIDTVLRQLAVKWKDQIVIIPISFLNENLETLYDIDHEIVPFGKKFLRFSHISRVALPVADCLLIKMFADLVLSNISS